MIILTSGALRCDDSRCELTACAHSSKVIFLVSVNLFVSLPNLFRLFIRVKAKIVVSLHGAVLVAFVTELESIVRHHSLIIRNWPLCLVDGLSYD